MEPDYEKVAEAVTMLLNALGEDTQREGLRGTPERVAKYYKEYLNPPEFKFTKFSSEGYNEMIIQRDIPFNSLCEHHLLSFSGLATVAYIPDIQIVGLSKLARTVELYSRRLQNQERITNQVALRLQEELQPLGVAVSLTASHSCMIVRGVKAHGSVTTTTKLIGAFKENHETRAEFLVALRG